MRGSHGCLAFDRLTWLGVGDNLFGFCSAFGALFFFIPVRIELIFDDNFGFGEQGAAGIRFGIDQGDGNLGHAERLALAGSGEDDVFHLAAAQALGALLAQNPAHALQDVGLSASIRPHDHGDSLAGQRDFGPITEGLEAQDLDFFQLQHADLLLKTRERKATQNRAGSACIKENSRLGGRQGQHEHPNILWIRRPQLNPWAGTVEIGTSLHCFCAKRTFAVVMTHVVCCRGNRQL